MDKDNYRRWYDKDPILSKAMRILETSDDNIQIQIAINLIKVIIEHNIINNSYNTVDDLISAVELGKEDKGQTRWYDIDKTLRTAIHMLESCPEETRVGVARDIAKIIKENFDTPEEFDDAPLD
ncbi:MAG: hypothetical protein WCK67_00365 [bacterium]